MPRYFETLTSRFRARNPEALLEFAAAAVLLGLALFFALSAQSAAQRGEHTAGTILALLALLIAVAVAVTAVPRLIRRVRPSRWLLPFSFSITPQGVVYLLAVFLISLAAINTGNNLLFLILATLLSAIIVSGIVARTSLRSVFVSLQVPENVFEAERISIKISLRNVKRFLPSFSIAVEDLGASPPGTSPGRSPCRSFRLGRGRSTANSILRHSAYFPAIMPGETRTELVMQSFPRRGRYRLEGFRLSTRFPFGIFRRGERVRADGEVLVYPSIQEISSYFHLLPFLPGRLEGLHVGPGESLYSIRKYREGESARLVHWKATAKTGELMVREHAREEESKFCLILDTLIPHQSGTNSEAAFEKAVSLAASLAMHFAAEGAELEFLTQHEYVPRGMGIRHAYGILRSLAVVSCRIVPLETSPDLHGELSGTAEAPVLEEILSDKVFKIIITSKPRGSLPAEIWRSSHVIYFDEL